MSASKLIPDLNCGRNNTVRTFIEVTEDLDRRQHITLGLERITALLDALDNPERALRIVQVVGTNGKGTTGVSVAAALEELGESTGAYLSPHVLSYTERVMLRGRYVTEVEFAAGMGKAIKAADENDIDASQFELLTAGALAMFRDAGLSFAVVEAGLGARHDATSAAEPEAVVLTNVSRDHTEYLGETVEEIAREKLASLSAGTRLILGDASILEIAREECRRRGARLVEAFDDEPGELAPGVAPYAARNVRLGVRAAESVVGRTLNEETLTRVLRKVRGMLPGRFEVRELGGVPVVVDGGHNPAGVRAAVAAVRSVYGERALWVVFGALRGKDIASMLTALTREAERLLLTCAENERALDPEYVLSEHEPRDRGGRRARVMQDADIALSVAADEARLRDGVVLVTGSLYLGARVLGRLREE